MHRVWREKIECELVSYQPLPLLASRRRAYVSICQHMSAYVSIREHTQIECELVSEQHLGLIEAFLGVCGLALLEANP
jgi:hypothetical protein